MQVKIHEKPSMMQKMFGREGIGSIEFIVEGADNSTIRTLRQLVPKAKDELTEFNPFSGSLHFTSRVNKKMCRFLEEAEKLIPGDQLPENYHHVVDYLKSRYN